MNGFIEVVKFFRRIFTGEIPVAQLYMMIAILIVAVASHIGRAVFWLFGTIYVYIDGYMVGWRVINCVNWISMDASL